MTNVAPLAAAAQAFFRLLEPRTLLGLGAGLSVFLVVGTLADWREVAAVASRLPPVLLLVSALGHLLGAICRGARWLLMLRGAGVHVAARRALAASFGSDLLGPLPASPFIASYVLHRNGAASAAQTVPVVLAGLWAEILVVIGGTAVVADAAPAIVRVLAATLCTLALVGAALLQWPAAHYPAWWLARGVARVGRGLIRWQTAGRWWDALDALPEWTPHLGRAFRVRTLVPALALTAIPMAAGAVVTAAVAASLGYPQLTAPRAWAASGTVMALALASPLPFDLGVVEGGQLLAYGWIGVPAAGALAISLIGRFGSATLGLAIAAVVTWLLRDELG
ncbi:MAG: lysylphosphatidylglycerol synthase domain-containing protein [Chloroflexota bacterium]